MFCSLCQVYANYRSFMLTCLFRHTFILLYIRHKFLKLQLSRSQNMPVSSDSLVRALNKLNCLRSVLHVSTYDECFHV